jgi:polyisoprenoid-binding protein YceI
MSPRLLLTLAALALGTAAPALAEEDAFEIDSSHTTPMFEIGHLGMSQQRGLFTDASGRITLDRAARRGSIDVVISTGSVVTASRALSNILKREDYFNADKFPAMTFRSRDLVFDGDVPVGANGQLTLLGVTRPVALKIAGFKCATHPYFRRTMCGAEVTATIKRSEFGMTAGLPVDVGDEVRIVIPVEAIRE